MRLRRILTRDKAAQEHLATVSEEMGLRNSVLLHERCFVGVEGPTELQVMPRLFRLATGLSLQSAGIALIAGNGNEGALKLIRFLRENGRRMSFVLVDSDSQDDKLFSTAKLKAAGVDPASIHYVGNRELEDLFTDAQWAATANRHWQRSDGGGSWTAQDFAGLRSAKKFSTAIEQVVRPSSDQAPSGKPGYLLALVQDLRTGAELPDALVSVLKDLQHAAE